MKKAYFTLRELGNDDCPNIGTISVDYTVDNGLKPDQKQMNEKLIEAVESHFDATIQLVGIIQIDFESVFNSVPQDFTVELIGEDLKYKCQIEQTFLY